MIFLYTSVVVPAAMMCLCNGAPRACAVLDYIDACDFGMHWFAVELIFEVVATATNSYVDSERVFRYGYLHCVMSEAHQTCLTMILYCC